MTTSDSQEQRGSGFRTQAEWCDKLGSPFTALLCRTLADRLDDTSGFGHRVLTWPLETLRGDLVALRCCGALHYHVRREPKSEVAKVYPPHPMPDADALWEETMSSRIALRAPSLRARSSFAFGSSIRWSPVAKRPQTTSQCGKSSSLIGPQNLTAPPAEA